MIKNFLKILYRPACTLFDSVKKKKHRKKMMSYYLKINPAQLCAIQKS